MAVVKLGKPVKSNLGGDNGAMAYIINPAKTDGGRLVSSNYERTRTDHDALAEGMLDDNRRSPKARCRRRRRRSTGSPWRPPSRPSGSTISSAS